MVNLDPNLNNYRHCIDETKGDCPFMQYNERNVPYCSIDYVIQVGYFGCIPADALHRRNEPIHKVMLPAFIAGQLPPHLLKNVIIADNVFRPPE